jgi:DNA-binding Lrp family transcriptional regulator
VEVEAGQALKVARRLAELDRARYVSYSAGGMKDVTVQIVARNLEEMYSYVSEVIGNVPGVEKTQTMLIPGVLKDVGDWVPPE